jgi:hypothetical protein
MIVHATCSMLLGFSTLEMMKKLFPSTCMQYVAGFLVVEPAHPCLSSRLGTGASIFMDLFKDLKALYF